MITVNNFHKNEEYVALFCNIYFTYHTVPLLELQDSSPLVKSTLRFLFTMTIVDIQ